MAGAHPQAQTEDQLVVRQDRPNYAALLLVLPALALLAVLYLYPLVSSIWMSLVSGEGLGLANYRKAFSLYWVDMVYTVAIAILSQVLVFVTSVSIAGYLRFEKWPLLNLLYRLPLFIPFLIVGHSMRVFLAPHGVMNMMISRVTGIRELPGLAFGWEGLVISYVWKQFPLATLLMLGAFESISDSMIEAAQNLGCSRTRAILSILLPISSPTVMVAMVLTFVSTIGCLSIPLLVGAAKPVMLPVDMSFRVTYFNDWGVANALGVISYLIVVALAYYYLTHMTREEGV